MAKPEHSPSIEATNDADKQQVGRDGDSHDVKSVTLHVRPRPDLPTHCLETFALAGIEVHSISILREHQRPGWRRVAIQIAPTKRGIVTELAQRIDEGDSAVEGRLPARLSP